MNHICSVQGAKTHSAITAVFGLVALGVIYEQPEDAAPRRLTEATVLRPSRRFVQLPSESERCHSCLSSDLDVSMVVARLYRESGDGSNISRNAMESTKPGTSRKRPKSGELNCRKQKL